MTWEQQTRPPTDGEVRATQIDPTAGIWFCQNCGRHIQVVTDSTVPKRQPFICVCGTRMTPGEEHSTLKPDASKTVDG